ncbi:MAG: hypothetical protein ABI601_08420 [bacterium]
MRSLLLAASAASFLLVAAACGGSETSAPTIGPPDRVEVASSPPTTGAVKNTVGTLAVKVSDASGQAVTGASVSFAANGGGGITLTPTSATTDATGTARTTIVLGTVAGTSTVTASVSGVTTPASITLTTIPGAVSRLVASPDNIRLNAIGDTARIIALAQDDYSNPIAGSATTYTAVDPTLVSVDGTGLVRALRVGGTTSVIATASGRADTVIVAVLAVGASACTGVSTPVNLAVGATSAVTGAQVCIGGGAVNSEFAVIAYNSSVDGSTLLNASFTANGVSAAPANSLTPTNRALAVRSSNGVASAPAPLADMAFHSRVLSMSHALNGRMSSARATRDARLSASRGSATGAFSPSASRTLIPATVAVGDLVLLNTNGTVACTAPQNKTFRVAAIGSKSIILADTANPKNGFSDTDYGRFAARFDTLVYPLDVGNFGAPSDLDANGKVAVLFTREVNALTPANSPSYVGGYFFARDLFPKKDATTTANDCPGSNEGEMFYMLVPDPTGQVNGNKHSLGFVDSLTTSVLAHEFQHLINAGRRLYFNTNASDFEDSWLNEGLSHIAEELLYYRESGMQPRQNLDDAAIRVNSRATYPLWKADAASNFGRLIDYLQDPGGSSMMDSDDNLATRGAAWSFLRYAVDRTYPNDTGVWSRFSNSIGTGVVTLRVGLQVDPTNLLADFSLANYIDDLGISTDPRFNHMSWNYRDIYTKTFIGFTNFPLLTTPVADNQTVSIQVKGASASYYRLSVGAGKEALLKFASGGGAPNSAFKFTVVRTK